MSRCQSWNLSLVAIVAAIATSCAAHPSEGGRLSAVDDPLDFASDAVTGWKCTTTGGSTQKSPEGRYYATSFGCWVDEDGEHRGDGDDNCIPYCIDEVCDGLDGATCEEKIKWYTASARRYPCGTRLQVSNPKNGKAVVVMVIDRGPNCSIEKKVKHWVADLSYPTTNYLFGGDMSAPEKGLVIATEVAASTPLGPVSAGAAGAGGSSPE